LDLICVAGFNGYFSDLSRSWEKTLGWSKKDLLSKPYIEFVHPEDQAATMVQSQNISTGRQLASFENRFLCKDGNYKWFHWTAIPHVEEEKIDSVKYYYGER
jgi:PAS domain S-box-containing protein